MLQQLCSSIKFVLIWWRLLSKYECHWRQSFNFIFCIVHFAKDPYCIVFSQKKHRVVEHFWHRAEYFWLISWNFLMIKGGIFNKYCEVILISYRYSECSVVTRDTWQGTTAWRRSTWRRTGWGGSTAGRCSTRCRTPGSGPPAPGTSDQEYFQRGNIMKS